MVMTYFGVNYYLSGLHSYAAGDPIPVPAWGVHQYWSNDGIRFRCLLQVQKLSSSK